MWKFIQNYCCRFSLIKNRENGKQSQQVFGVALLMDQEITEKEKIEGEEKVKFPIRLTVKDPS